jgi:DNA invertase Pin-like site-specific DNA recombinase
MDAIIALTYRRVSIYRQERDGVSLDVQTDQCIDDIRRQPGWRLGGDFQDTLTGRTAKRRDYQRMLAEARQLREHNQQVVIVTAALDRMGRDLGESVRARKELRGLGVPLHCIREGGVLQELQADVYASIAADESRRIAARVAGSRKRFRDRG